MSSVGGEANNKVIFQRSLRRLPEGWKNPLQSFHDHGAHVVCTQGVNCSKQEGIIPPSPVTNSPAKALVPDAVAAVEA